jgi:hypothetical protein
MPASLTTVAYLVAGVLFILSLSGLSAQDSARRGNLFGIIGMVLAVAVTAISGVTNYAVMALARGVVAFRTPQPADLRVDETGLYVIRVKIPGRLLADTIYTVKVGILVEVDGRQTTLVSDNALVFRVYANHDSNDKSLLRLYHGSSWSGVVMPELEWEVVRERDVVIAP